MMKYNYSERGRSMVEMMGYLAVMMAIIIAVGRIVTNAFDTHRYSTASLQLTELATAITKAGAIDVDYSEILKEINGQSDEQGNKNGKKLVPTSFRQAGNKIYHAFGGEVIIGASPFDEPDCTEGNCKRSDQFSITFNHLSQKQCTELGVKNWQANKYVDLFALRVNGTYWFWPAYGGSGDGADDSFVFPVKRVILTGTKDKAGKCAPGDTNALTWVFN